MIDRRPDFLQAARPRVAEPLMAYFVARLDEQGLRVATGRFQAVMQVALVNDGPVTLWLDTADVARGGGGSAGAKLSRGASSLAEGGRSTATLAAVLAVGIGESIHGPLGLALCCRLCESCHTGRDGRQHRLQDSDDQYYWCQQVEQALLRGSVSLSRWIGEPRVGGPTAGPCAAAA